MAGAEDDGRKIDPAAHEIAMVERLDLETDPFGQMPDVVRLDARVRNRHPGKQHGLGARPAEIGCNRREAGFESLLGRDDIRLLVHDPPEGPEIDAYIGYFFLTGARMSNGRSFFCSDGVRA
ncbi:hypothetical protein [Mesorhizobium sp.]|uniref:hypothetical protein n=1 Tax=Mesorhizobium sp. TaxID=1871066 RepID=UPI0025D02C96|nr:hypothetical protein [Mesorhizobium sp.]